MERKGCEAEWKRLNEADHKYVWHPFTQMADWVKEETLVIESASGMKLKSITGEEYYDGHSSYWVNVHGHGNPELSRTLARETAKLDHSTFLGLSNRPAIDLAEKLVEITPKGLSKVFFSDNGSTAVEVGMKMAVQYFRQREKGKSRKKRKFIALGEAYHGDTLGAVAVGGVEIYRNIFGPLLADVVFTPSPYCYRCPLKKFPSDCSLACAAEMEKLIVENHEDIAAFVIEPIVQGPGGIIVAPSGYLKRVRELCTKYDILMLADEVAVGFGRTGKMFACEHEEVEPDLMALSKSLGAGLVPIAATMATDEIYEAFLGKWEEQKTFFHGHTFTAHPPACAVALQSLNLYRKQGIIRQVETKSQALADSLVRFENLPHVGDIRQKGMIAGIELVKNRETKERFEIAVRAGNMVSKEARRNGLIVRPLGDTLVLFPILSVSEGDLRKMTDILYNSIAAVTGSFEKNEPFVK
ncbi:MAG: adenosylmethionine--8-amino-7-oxononanoate transaminase [Nitrospinota bacterium]|nr:adenosylmethionine--8-amino-7-oxononanoate transaminase [Nitrospinota bacterium]